jgi:hypothetical protein
VIGIAHRKRRYGETTDLASRSPFAALLLLLLSSSATSSAAASGTTATLRGRVEDATGGVLPGATVTMVNTGTSAVRSAITDERGEFVFSSLTRLSGAQIGEKNLNIDCIKVPDFGTNPPSRPTICGRPSG